MGIRGKSDRQQQHPTCPQKCPGCCSCGLSDAITGSSHPALPVRDLLHYQMPALWSLMHVRVSCPSVMTRLHVQAHHMDYGSRALPSPAGLYHCCRPPSFTSVRNMASFWQVAAPAWVRPDTPPCRPLSASETVPRFYCWPPRTVNLCSGMLMCTCRAR